MVSTTAAGAERSIQPVCQPESGGSLRDILRAGTRVVPLHGHELVASSMGRPHLRETPRTSRLRARRRLPAELRTVRFVILAVVISATVVANAGGNAEFTRAELEQAWIVLLEDAVSGDEEARVRIERARAEGGHEAIRKLADLLFAEWGLDPSDERFETATLVWLSEIDFASLPPYALEVSSPMVVISVSWPRNQ